MGTYGREPQERVERETAQRPGMGPDAQIPLCEQGLHGQRQHLRTHGGEHRQECLRRIEPHQACGRRHEFGGHVDELAAQVWQQTQAVHAVAALGHVRRRAALEVAVAKAWNLG